MAARFSVQACILRVAREADSRPDAQLLQRFLQHRDEHAFAELIRRHGPTVLGVCRRMLGDSHDAEDAFQATFLVLVRKARAIAQRDRLGGWLHGVAFRTAQKARFRRARQRAVERPIDETTPEPAMPRPPGNDWPEWLDGELLGLPEKYRLPLLLCELRGLSRRDAAHQLGLPEGTVSSRLARGRHLLRQRLIRRGVKLTAGALLTGLASQARCELAPALVGATVETATLFVTNRSVVGVISAAVLNLTEGVCTSMFLSKLKIALVILPVLAMGALGFHAAAARVPTEGSEQARPAEPLQPRQGATKAAQKGPAQKVPAPDARPPVAVIFDDIPITREELGEFLIARYGAQKIDALVNRRILEHVCAQKGVEVTEQEIQAALNEELALMKISRTDFENQVLPRYNRSLFEWREDVIRPKLLLGKLCRGKIAVTEDDLRQMFEHLYGKKVACKLIMWRKEEENAARKMYDAIARSDEAFDQAARSQFDHTLAANCGRVPPVARYSQPTHDSALEEEAFRLRRGEVSSLRTMQDGKLFVVKCVGHVLPAEGKAFDAERPRLMKEVIDRKLAAEMPKLFKAYRDAARPRILLQPRTEMSNPDDDAGRPQRPE
jgi:RNA polymerase sigma factor (sigma-70 family)